MSAMKLPIEILQKIFGDLNGKDISQCSKVCRRWELAVDGLGDKFWRGLCAKDHGDVYEEAYRKADLSWRELGRSLDLWPEVSAADVNVYQVPVKDTNQFYLLQNGIVSCCQRSKDDCPNHHYDTIVHYDLATLRERHRETLDVFFRRYSESDTLLVLEIDRHIRIIPKANKNNFKEVFKELGPWILRRNEVFFEYSYGNLSRIKFIQIGNEVSLKQKVFSGLNGNLEDVAYVGDELNVFVTHDNYMYINQLVDNELEYGYCITDYDNPLEIVKSCGFSWASEKIFNWLSYSYDDLAYFGKHKITIAYELGKVVIIALQSELKLHIFYDQYDSNAQLTLDDLTPDKSIDLRLCMQSDSFQNVYLLDTAEAVNGHKVLILLDRRIFVLELSHGTERKKPISPAPTTSGSL